jgi:hypothetical protein
LNVCIFNVELFGRKELRKKERKKRGREELELFSNVSIQFNIQFYFIPFFEGKNSIYNFIDRFEQ